MRLGICKAQISSEGKCLRARKQCLRGGSVQQSGDWPECGSLNSNPVWPLTHGVILGKSLSLSGPEFSHFKMKHQSKFFLDLSLGFLLLSICTSRCLHCSAWAVSSCRAPERVGSVGAGPGSLQLRCLALVAPWHMGSQFPDRGSNRVPCRGRWIPNKQTTGEVSASKFLTTRILVYIYFNPKL